MSVGGKVLETLVLRDRVWVNTFDGDSECAIYVELTPESRTITAGDSLWWQAAKAFWTPRSIGGAMPFTDRSLERIGFSGISRNQALQRLQDQEAVEQLITRAEDPDD